MPTIEQLEEVYTRVLGLVKRQVDAYEEREELDSSELKGLEGCDKIIRASLDYYGSKVPKTDYDTASTEDLAKEFE